MLLINLFWICFSVYLYFTQIKLYRASYEQLPTQTLWENALATFGELCYMLHDWFFTEQYLKASLMMPIAISNLKDDFEENEGETMT